MSKKANLGAMRPKSINLLNRKWIYGEMIIVYGTPYVNHAGRVVHDYWWWQGDDWKTWWDMKAERRGDKYCPMFKAVENEFGFDHTVGLN